MRSICVFCGSSPGARDDYAAAAAALAAELARRDLRLVYGGAAKGTMGLLADAALAAGGRVTGVIPRSLLEREVAHDGLDDLRVVESMHERKALMAELADGFVAMPGGYGTFEEILEVLTWGQLGLHGKPCGLLNVAGYYDCLLEFLDVARDEAFLKPVHRDLLLVADEPGALLDRYAGWRAPSESKWRD